MIYLLFIFNKIYVLLNIFSVNINNGNQITLLIKTKHPLFLYRNA